MERKDFINKYWRYYLILENKFINTFQFVEPVEENFKTFSNEFVLLIQSIGAEIDLVFKQFCELDLENRHTINEYYDAVLNKFSDIRGQEIVIKDFNYSIKPFDGWVKEYPGQSLRWWSAYNGIKHNRILTQKDANFENVLNILGALFLLEMKYIQLTADVNKEPDIPDIDSELFYIKDWNHRWSSMQTVFAVTV